MAERIVDPSAEALEESHLTQEARIAQVYLERHLAKRHADTSKEMRDAFRKRELDGPLAVQLCARLAEIEELRSHLRAEIRRHSTAASS